MWFPGSFVFINDRLNEILNAKRKRWIFIAFSITYFVVSLHNNKVYEQYFTKKIALFQLFGFFIFSFILAMMIPRFSYKWIACDAAFYHLSFITSVVKWLLPCKKFHALLLVERISPEIVTTSLFVIIIYWRFSDKIAIENRDLGSNPPMHHSLYGLLSNIENQRRVQWLSGL